MTLNLKKLSVDDLLVLRDRINRMLENRVVREQQELQARLERLQAFKISSPSISTTSMTSPKREHKNRGRKLAPKYRNPENYDQTWAGRGKQPRWMRAASVKDLDHFRI